VVGSSTVLVLDPSEVRHSTMAEASLGEPVSITNVRLHILTPGMRYDIDARKPILE